MYLTLAFCICSGAKWQVDTDFTHWQVCKLESVSRVGNTANNASSKEVEFESNSAKDSFELNLGAEMAKLVALSLSQRKVLLSFVQKEISQRFVL